MKKYLILATLFATVSALPAQAGLLSLGSGLAASAGSTGFGTTGHAGADSSINTTGIESQKVHDDAALSGLLDAETNASASTNASVDTSGSNPVLPRHKQNKGLLKSTAATELDAKAKADARSGQPHHAAPQSAVASGVSSQAEANANGTYNR